MDNDSPLKALLVVFAIALVCSVLVSVSVVTLRPIQERNALVERLRIGWPGIPGAPGGWGNGYQWRRRS